MENSLYGIYVNKVNSFVEKGRDYEFINVSKTSKAKWATFFWAFSNRMWLVGFLSLSIFILLAVFLTSILPIDSIYFNWGAVIYSIVWVLYEVFGNSWREKSLLSKGYIYVGQVEAKNTNEAMEMVLNEGSLIVPSVRLHKALEVFPKDKLLEDIERYYGN